MLAAAMPKLIIIMGVSGAGKTYIGRALAARLGWTFLDADDFHPPANVDKMRAGEPLTDADRAPWLDALHRAIADRAAAGESTVLACSALKQGYRDRLATGLTNVRWVHLRVGSATARMRLAQRANHFMPVNLIDSQFEALEPPRDALVVNGEQPADRVIEAIVIALEGD